MADPVTLTLAATTALSAGSQIAEGRAMRKAGESEASQMYANARRRREQGEAQAAAERRRMRIALSDAQAGQAAAGGTSTDPSSLAAQGDLAGQHRYNELAYLYEADMDAEGMRRAGRNRKETAQAASRASNMRALSTVMRGGTQTYNSFSDWMKAGQSVTVT